MITKQHIVALGAAGVLAVASPLFAHHSWPVDCYLWAYFRKLLLFAFNPSATLRQLGVLGAIGLPHGAFMVYTP